MMRANGLFSITTTTTWRKRAGARFRCPQMPVGTRDVPAAFALRTLNLICGDVTHRRPVTMAFANSRCVPSPTVALFHGLSHGAPFPSQATWTLSTYHLTCVAPAPLAVAALSTISPDTVEPDAGASPG